MKIDARKLLVGSVAGVLAVACVGFGAGKAHKSAQRDTQVSFPQTVRFQNGDTLPAGDYRMEVSEGSQTPDVTFRHEGKTMATEKASVVLEEKKNETTEVDAITQGTTALVTAIHPAGWHEELTFGSAEQNASQ